MTIYHKLKTLLNEIFTLIYYELPNHQEKIYNEILIYADLTKKFTSSFVVLVSFSNFL